MNSELTTMLASALAGSELLRGVAPETITGLQPRRRQLSEGALLFRTGESASCAYLILSGILGLHTGDGDDTQAFFRKVVPGELVGEYGPLCGLPRSATAVALTAVDSLELSRNQLQQLLQEAPVLGSRLISVLAGEASVGRTPGRTGLKTIVIHNANPESPLTAAVRSQLPERLRLLASESEGLDDVDIHPGNGDEAELHRWLVEANHARRPQVLFNQNPRAVSHRNLLLIDRLLVLADGCAPTLNLPAAAGQEALLVRLWPQQQQCPETRAWENLPLFAQVLNIKPGEPGHLTRLARAVLRRQRVLVLGGGGARGFAHIGVLAALEQLGLRDLDMVIGVSIGSLVASLVAFEHPAATIFNELERVIIKSRPYSFTLPRASLFSLDNSRRELERFFGAAQIQDSWLSLRCFSTNLSSKRLQGWGNGDIPTAVIASMSVPGIFPPVSDAQGNLHVDGGILNNLPVAEARRVTDGQVLAISLDPTPENAGAANGSHGPITHRPPSLGRTIIDAMMCGSHAETQAQEALANLVLRPRVEQFQFLDWKRYQEIYAVGYQDALKELQAGWPSGAER
jgi:NTE family protein